MSSFRSQKVAIPVSSRAALVPDLKDREGCCFLPMRMSKMKTPDADVSSQGAKKIGTNGPTHVDVKSSCLRHFSFPPPMSFVSTSAV
ncbi:hypothetical protein RUM44_002288 [Polyplax serrata]|uniref:Uncharacterized protein n=1 Tax=Polyplax serrata TaxID=468196 RepID=A0ABR1AN54_POLSC